MPQRRLKPFPVSRVTLAIAALAFVDLAAAQATPQRIEITGSSIKRLEGEAALPVQTIGREDIEKSGVTTAAELLKNISSATANLGDGASITDNTGGQRGFNGANLRGLGVSSTLVLLNGRRMANFASPGDAAGVDLNSIPAGAIRRVEVLKDGASAIYGTDAIGGVINFITRQDYSGIEAAVTAAATEQGGAGKRTGTLSAGIGDLESSGFNVFGTLDVQKLDALRSTQRDFIQERPLASTVPFYLSSRPFPGNIRLSGTAATRNAQLAAINAAGYRFNGGLYTDRTVNLFAPTCNPPASVYAQEFLAQACGYDYMRDTEIYPEQDKISFIGRGVLRIGQGTNLFAEVMAARAETLYVLSPNPTGVTGVTWAAVNPYLPNPVTHGSTFEIRMRATEAGNRSNEVTSDARRVVLGVEGVLGNGWDYTAAASHAINKVADRYVNGYFLFNEFSAALRNGQINPFGPSPAAGQALIQSLRIDDVARRSEGTTSAVDAKVSGTIGRLAGGDVGMAVGAEFRIESQDFTPSALLLSNNIAGDRSGAGLPGPQATSHERKIASAYAEISAPFTKQLEMQFALRFDKYEGVGSTTNPKIGLRWQPAPTVVVRGSAGTGFRAPSFSELYRPTTYGTSPAFLYDSVWDGFDQFPTEKYANPNLKPEKSKQFSLGVVFEPVRDISVGLDWWSITKTDIISDLSGKTILNNPTRYANYIVRDPIDDYPTLILRKENQGRLETSGVDIELKARGPATAAGRFSGSFSGTYVAKYDRQFGAAEPMVSNAGRFLNDQVVQRWRHRAGFDWSLGNWTASLGNSYFSSYADDSYLEGLAPRRVAAYSLWDASASWNPTKDLKVRIGIQNLLDKDPPFSNQSYYFLATYDPTYTDPRGRTYTASVSYRFK
jgi:iron complex outermembrane receptor protein